MKTINLVLLSLLIILFSGNVNVFDGTSVENDNSNADNLILNNKLYGIKSGKILYEMDMLFFTMSIITYFDDYGNKRCDEVNEEIFGEKVHTRNITVGEDSYEIDMLTDTAVYKKIEINSEEAINYYKITDEIMKKHSIKEEGKEEFLGKKCNVYSMEGEEGTTTKVYVWEGIQLKTKIEAKEMTMTIEAIDIDTKTEVPQHYFEVPEGVYIKK